MAIQSTQVPMYTNTHYFCIFMKNKINQNWKEKKKKKKVMHKTRLTQNKNKTHKLCKNRNTRREKKVIKSLRAIFLPHPRRTFPLIKTLNWRWGGRIETVQVRKEHEGFENISKGSKRGWKLILVSWCNCVVALLSG